MADSILWRSLSREANRAASKCSSCGKFGHVMDDCPKPCSFCGVEGHGPSDCPKLAHIQSAGITVERSEGDLGVAFGVFLLLLGFFMGVSAHKLVEAFIQ